MDNQQIDYGKLGKQRFCKFCRAIKKLIQDDGLHFDLLIAAGNSGQSLAKFTEFIYQELNREAPPKLRIPFFRYFPGYRDNPDKIFDSKIFLPEIINQLKNLKNQEIKNVLFVDDEIGLGLTATNIFNLLNQALNEIGKPQIENYYIVAEDQGFKVPKEYTEIKFIPYDFELDGYNNVIFFFNPRELEKPIIDALGDDDKFSFHLRTNLLLGLPIKDFNDGQPIYTDKFLKITKEKVSDFQKLQESYLTFIKNEMKECFRENMSFAQTILNSKKPFVLFHTHSVTKDILQQAIHEGKSMDLDVCVDDTGKAYLGHSKEYHDKSGDPWEENMPLWEAVDVIAQSDILVIVDCKHFDAWSFVEEVVNKIGAEKCLVHTFASEFKFDYSREKDEPDFLTEWSPIEKLSLIKSKFPTVSTCVSCKWLPNDLLLSAKYKNLLQNIRRVLKENKVDTLCLNVPNETFSNDSLQFFLAENIIPHIGIDNIDRTKLSEIYIGETDNLNLASLNSSLKTDKI